MSYLDQKEPPRRENRLHSRITYGGTLCDVAKKTRGCCLDDADRSFSQGSICLLLPALAMINSLPDNVTILHGAIGCGSCAHSQNANVRSGGNIRWGKVKDALWLSTALNEVDVISGGEVKLEKAIVEADRRYRPATITVVAGCVPGIICDDIDVVADKVQTKVSARIIPVHCEGFKTKIWASAYDAVYHGIGQTLLEEPEYREPAIPDELYDLQEEYRLKHTVNLFNVSSMGRGDEKELTRLLNALGLEVNIFPVFTRTEDMYKVTQAALSISTCPTHDDYFVKILEEKYGVPYILKHMPIGINNTNQWLRSVAAFFGLEELAEQLIREENRELEAALEEFRPYFKDKLVFVSAGEFRALATAGLLAELGFQLSGVRAYHHDEFAQPEYEKLLKLAPEDLVFNIADCQPFEEINLLHRLKPDLFLGHWNGNGVASKLGIPTHVIYNTGLNYIGYQGVYDLARRLYRQLQNPSFNRQISRHSRMPYKESWYQENPFTFIRDTTALGGAVNE